MNSAVESEMEMSYIAKSRAIAKIVVISSRPTAEDYEWAAAEFDKRELRLPIVSQVPETCYPNLFLESLSFHQVWFNAVGKKGHFKNAGHIICTLILQHRFLVVNAIFVLASAQQLGELPRG